MTSDLRFGAGLDVSLGGPEVRVPGQHLHVTQGPEAAASNSDRGHWIDTDG